MVLSEKGKEKHLKNNSDTSDDEIDELEEMIARRVGRRKGKYKGKHPIIYFPCNKVGHIATRCHDREDKDESKYKGRRDDREFKKNKDYKDNGKKSCYIVEDKIDNEFKSR